MFDALSFTEIDGQHPELLPARTVLSTFGMGGSGGGGTGGDCNTSNGNFTQSGLLDVAAANNLNVLNNTSLIPIVNVLSKSC